MGDDEDNALLREALVAQRDAVKALVKALVSRDDFAKMPTQEEIEVWKACLEKLESELAGARHA